MFHGCHTHEVEVEVVIGRAAERGVESDVGEGRVVVQSDFAKKGKFGGLDWGGLEVGERE